jgi:fructokinase
MRHNKLMPLRPANYEIYNGGDELQCVKIPMTEQSKKHNTQPIAIFGEVLMDQFPDGHQVLGGAPFNVAWHLQAFGQRPCFISRIGNDAMGGSIRQAMTGWGMSVENVQTDPDYPTGTVKVTINKDEPGYEILANQAYDFIAAQQLNPANQYSVIYHGTLALRNRVSEQALNNLRARHTGKVFVDVNLRAPWWRQESVNQWVSNADWVKLNHEELMQLTPPQNTLQDAMQLFLTQHDLDVLIVTCGSSGSTALNSTGEFFKVAPVGDLPIADTVGAGDAFSAVLLLGMQQGWPLSVTMARAQAFASALVTRRGATVQDLDFYQIFIGDWNLA